MKTISRYIMTLALLLTAVTGAWADEVTVTFTQADLNGESTVAKDGVTLTPGNNDARSGANFYDSGSNTFSVDKGTFTKIEIVNCTDGDIDGWQKEQADRYRPNPVDYPNNWVDLYTLTWTGEAESVTFTGNVYGIQRIVFTIAEPPSGPEVAWDASTKTGTFTMPGSDVVLTPIYSAATIYDANQTEKMAYETLKEAFANVQEGDVIKLDWNVTLTEDLETPTIDGGVEFTLDFNGYTLDGGTTYIIQLKNAGDQLTFTDSSDDQLGGLITKGFNNEDGSKFVFDAGRYNIGGATAEIINGFCAIANSPLSLPEGKEFIDLEGGAAANDGFMVRVDYKAIELTIGAGKFATFYMDQNITLADGTDANIGLYTINGEGINRDNNTVTVTKVNDPIAIAGMPLLVYNGTTEQKTVTLRVTPDQPTAPQMWSTHFQGTAVDKTFDADDMAANDYYVLSGGKAFAPVRGTGTIAKNKCWLEFAKQEIPSARQLTIVFDSEATGIRSMDNGQLIMDNWYDLNGRKLNAKPTRKGVYIQNGQKVVK